MQAGPLPPHLQHLPYDELQFTLVDCPGHASLIRTIIGGVHIIDMIVLVIDVMKGKESHGGGF
jgi:selenocysteine-specific elongation factor